MSILEITDFIGVIIIYQGLQFSFLLLQKKTRKFHFNVILALLFISLSFNFLNMLLLNSNIISINFGPFFGLCYGPLFLLYASGLIYRDKKVNRTAFFHFIPALIILFAVPFLNELLFNPIFGIAITFTITSHIALYLFLSHRKVRWYQRSLKNIASHVVDANLSWLKFLIYSIAVVFTIVLIESLVSRNEIADSITIISIYVFVLFFFNRIYSKGQKQPKIFLGIADQDVDLSKDIDSKYASSKLTELDALGYMERLKNHMLDEKPFLQFELTLDELANQTNIPNRYLSQMLNERLGRNFFDFVNGHRIGMAKNKLSDPALDLRVNEIMYTCGFNSKSTFNSVFKKSEGMTPSAYRKMHQKN